MVTLLKSEEIFDVATQSTFAGAIAISGQKISAVYRAPVDEAQFDVVRDFGAQMIVPGFVDAHQHTYVISLVQAGALTPIDYGTMPEVLAQVAKVPEFAGWKIPMGYYASEFNLAGTPTSADIDAIEADIPVMLVAGDVHSIWLNSKALAKIHVTEKDLAVAGGEIFRDATGAMTGFFTEGIATHVLNQVLATLVASMPENYLSYFRELNQQGVTSVGVLAVSGRADQDLINEDLFKTIENDMTVRAALFPGMRQDETRLQHLLAEFENSDRVQIAGTKQFYDGVTSTQTAYMVDDYFPGSGEKGAPMLPDETLHALIKRSNALDLPIRVHAIGDRAIRETLMAFEAAEAAFPMSPGKRNVIEHLEVFNPADLPRLTHSRAILSVQPSHALISYEGLWKEVGEARLPWMFTFRQFIDHGATLAFGTDAPVVIGQTPIQTIFQAVTRRTLANEAGVGLGFDEAVTIGEAITAHTLHAAQANQQTNVGQIAPGYFADLAILSQNLLTTAPDQLLTVETVATVFDGQFVWEK